MASIYPSYPPRLTEEHLKYLLDIIKEWSMSHGLSVRPSDRVASTGVGDTRILAIPAPVTLFPSLFPRQCFEEAFYVQKAYNELYARITQDKSWLADVISESVTCLDLLAIASRLIEVDDFISKLWKIHTEIENGDGYAQDLELGLFRSDYLVHVDPDQTAASPQIRQVEFNTISSSFGGLSALVSNLHRYLLGTAVYPANKQLKPSRLPLNDATSSLVAGLAKALKSYGPSKAKPALPLCVLFVVQSGEKNVFDQLHLQHALQSRGIAVFRMAFDTTFEHTKITDPPSSPPSRPLLFIPPHLPSNEHEVAVIYFRSTYAPSDFPDEKAWTARAYLERSSAIKCPSILTQLAGTKKVQQVLATPGTDHVTRLLKDEAMAKRVQSTFAAIYPMDDSEAGKTAKSLAMDPENCKGYVLKPQREGGGNNIYRSAIPPFLRELGYESKWRGHILMELIEPPAQSNTIVREGKIREGEVIAELGVFGTCVWRRDSREILWNSEAGYLLRTKGKESEEGGVAAGFGSIDSVCLVDV